MLPHEQALQGYSRNIGGSSGKGTHGGNIERPKNMPSRDDADRVVATKNELINAVQKDGATVWLDRSVDEIDVSGAKNVRFGDDVTIVGGFCDPSIKGRGPVIRQKHYERHLFISKWGTAPTLWGVSLRGPNTSYFDPRDRAKSSDWDSDSAEDWYASGLWCYDESELNVYGCEFWGWTLAGLEIGSRGHETPATIKRSSFHHCIMETLGYGIEHYSGDIWMDRCFFEACRHGFSGFGYPTELVDVTNSVIGPADDTKGWCGHALDMHKVDNNLHNGDWTAGGHFRIRNCTSMCTRDLGGYDQEGFAIRGTSENQSWEDKNHWFQKKKPTAPGTQGDAYRQEVKRGGWDNFEPRDSIYGERPPANVPAGYGAPRAIDRVDGGTETPDEPHNTIPMTKLEIRGKGQPANYWIYIDGDAKPGDEADKGDHVTTKDGETVIVGYVSGGPDTYELGEGADITGVWTNGRADVFRGGKRINDMTLISAGVDKHQSSAGDGTTGNGGGADNGTSNGGGLPQLRKRVDALEQKLNTARIIFGSDDS